MNRKTIAIGLALSLLAACKQQAGNSAAPTVAAAKAAGTDTIAKGLAGASSDSKFVAAVKAARLEPTFAGPGPYTVLVPDDNAFARLPAGALDGLMKADAKPRLVKLLTMHVLPGTILSSDITKAIDAKNGSAKLITMEGSTLTATKDGDKIVLTDPTGGKSVITGADAKRSNGVVHHIDTVLNAKA